MLPLWVRVSAELLPVAAQCGSQARALCGGGTWGIVELNFILSSCVRNALSAAVGTQP